MTTNISVPGLRRDPWNKGRLIGQKSASALGVTRVAQFRTHHPAGSG